MANPDELYSYNATTCPDINHTNESTSNKHQSANTVSTDKMSKRGMFFFTRPTILRSLLLILCVCL